MELIDDLNTCIDEKYFEQSYLEQLKDEGYIINKLLNGYIAYLKRRKDKGPNKPISSINQST